MEEVACEIGFTAQREGFQAERMKLGSWGWGGWSVGEPLGRQSLRCAGSQAEALH